MPTEWKVRVFFSNGAVDFYLMASQCSVFKAIYIIDHSFILQLVAIIRQTGAEVNQSFPS